MIVLLQVKDSIQTTVNFKAEKVLCMFLSTTKLPLRVTKYSVPIRLYSNNLKRSELKAYVSLKGNKFASFINS